jgi:hypothetical protein
MGRSIFRGRGDEAKTSRGENSVLQPNFKIAY